MMRSTAIETDDLHGLDPVYADPLTTRPGFFVTALVRKGPPVIARLWRVEERFPEGHLMFEPIYRAAIMGRDVDAASPRGWPWRRISASQYRYMQAKGDWAQDNAPDEPEANPHRPVSQSKIRLIP